MGTPAQMPEESLALSLPHSIAKLLNHNPAQFTGREDWPKQVKQSIFVQLLQVYL